jgi:hypothetical protein
MMDGRDSHIPNEYPENSGFGPGLKNTYKGLKHLPEVIDQISPERLKNTYKGLKRSYTVFFRSLSFKIEEYL